MDLSKENEKEMEKIEGFNHCEPLDPLTSLFPFLYFLDPNTALMMLNVTHLSFCMGKCLHGQLA